MFCCGIGDANRHLGTGFSVHKGIISAVEGVEFITHRMLYVTLMGRWFNVIVLLVYAPT